MSSTYKPNTNTTIANGVYPTGTISNTVLTSNGGGGASWTHPNAHFNNSNGQAVMTIPHSEDKIIIEDRAELEVKGRIKLNGADLDERLKTIEKVLMIPERDVILESKHPKLKEMYDEYMNALAKYRTWETLKDSK